MTLATNRTGKQDTHVPCNLLVYERGGGAVAEWSKAQLERGNKQNQKDPRFAALVWAIFLKYLLMKYLNYGQRL